MQRGKCNVALAAGGRCTSTCSTEIRCGRWTRPRRRSSSCPSTPSPTACTSGHVGTGTGPTPPTSAPGLAPPRYVLPARPPRRESNAPTCALARIAILTFMVRAATHTGTSDASASVVCCALSACCMFYVVCCTLGSGRHVWSHCKHDHDARDVRYEGPPIDGFTLDPVRRRATCRMQQKPCTVQHAKDGMQHSPCYMQHATDTIWPSTFNI